MPSHFVFFKIQHSDLKLFSLKRTTLIPVLSCDWCISGLTPQGAYSITQPNNTFVVTVHNKIHYNLLVYTILGDKLLSGILIMY